MAASPQRSRSRLRLGLLALTALTLVTLDFRGFGPLETAQSGLRDLLQPVADGADVVFGPISDAWTAAFSYGDLQRRNEELRDQVDALRGGEIRAEAARAAILRREQGDGSAYAADFDYLLAEVIRDNIGNFGSDIVTIDKGRLDGVEPGMAVVTAAGFVGRIESVGSGQATVVTVSDPDLVVGVRLLDTGEVGLGHGVSGDRSRFVIDTGLSWPETPQDGRLAEVGTAVVTAASSRHPADVPVGRVVSVEPAEAGLVQHVTVDLAVDTANLGHVTVLLTVPTELPPSGPDSPFEQDPTNPDPGDPVPGELGPVTQDGSP